MAGPGCRPLVSVSAAGYLEKIADDAPPGRGIRSGEEVTDEAGCRER